MSPSTATPRASRLGQAVASLLLSLAGLAWLDAAPLQAATGDSPEAAAELAQFSDLQPHDWAYQALLNLRQRYGCVAGDPSAGFQGQQPLSRYEAAALLQACLARIDTITDDLQRLLSDLQPELAALRRRTDALEARVGELEARGFSTTTRLAGQATLVLGAMGFGGSNTTLRNGFRDLEGGTSANYDLHLDLDTSFSGKDLLHLRLRAGNFADSGFGNGVLPNELEVAFQQDCGLPSDCGDVLAVERLFYQVPLREGLTITVGPKVRQDDMLGQPPSVYPAETILDALTYGGAPGTYNSNLGAGAGLVLREGGFSFTAQYITTNGDAAVTRPQPGCVPSSETTPDCGGGIGNASSASTATVQVGYGSDQLGLAVAYTFSSRFWGDLYGGDATELAARLALLADTHSIGLSGWWQPLNSGWLPSISAGWGFNMSEDLPGLPGRGGVQTQSWSLGLQWDDAFVKGNTLGIGVGQPTFVTHLPAALQLPDGRRIGAGSNDGSYVWEGWYRFQVSDQISVTPAVFYLSAPLGQLQKGSGQSFDNFGVLIKTSFRF